jgi:hypothetical protein
MNPSAIRKAVDWTYLTLEFTSATDAQLFVDHYRNSSNTWRPLKTAAK